MEMRMVSKLSESRNGTRSGSVLSNRPRRPSKTLACNDPLPGIEQLDTDKFDSYMEIMWNKIPTERRFSCTCVDSLWFTSYFKKGYKQKALRWFSNVKIFTKRYVFVPICQCNHWNLLILCNLGEDVDSKTKSPCILLLDSLQNIEGDIKPMIRGFLLAIYANENREESKDCIKNIPIKLPKVPQQQDGSRCGYYVLYYIYRFLMSCPDHFNLSDHYPGFMKIDWFSHNEIDSFCENLLSLHLKTEKEPSCEESDVEILDDLNGEIKLKGDPVEVDKDDLGKQERKDATKKEYGKKAKRNESSSSYSNAHPTTSTGAKQRQQNVRKSARPANTTWDADIITPLRKSPRTASRVHNQLRRNQVVKLTHEDKELEVFTKPTGTAGQQKSRNSADFDHQSGPGPSFSLFVDFRQYGPLPVIPNRKLDNKDDDDQLRARPSFSLCVDFTKYGPIPVIPNRPRGGGGVNNGDIS